jgi:adenylate kinase
MLNVVLFGPPGAGKGTQAQFIIENYQLVHLSTGDILRGEVKAGTELGKKAAEIMNAGELVSDEIVIGMISNKIDANLNSPGFIFDGFPRTVAQAEALDRMLAAKNTAITCTVSLEVKEEELTRRLLGRALEQGRKDDTEEVIRNRVANYFESTLPVAGFYEAQGKLHAIDGLGTVPEIAGRISEVLEKMKTKA